MKKEKPATKLCKYCKTEIPYGAKVCPQCRKKQGSTLKTVIIVIIALGLLGSCFGGNNKSSESVSHSVSDSHTETKVQEETTAVETTAVESEDEFKSSCEEINYKTLLRNPDDYIGQRIVITAKIQQITQGGLFDNGQYYRVMTDENGYGLYLDDEYIMYDCRQTDTTKLLDGDIIKVYAEFFGTQTITRALTNTKEDIPSINAYYVDIIAE